jgi:hypothetical protein
MNTKYSSLPVIAFLVVLAAIVILPVGPAVACGALTLTGMASIFLADYGRALAPLAA